MFNPEKLKQCREEKKISGEDLVFELRLLGLSVTRQTIYIWEAGKGAPKANDLEVIAKYFEKPMEYFFDNKPHQSSKVK